jgi:hypothetical protein
VHDSEKDDATWLRMGQILINLAYVAAMFDSDGVDLEFTSNRQCNQHKVKDWAEVMHAFSSAKPSNPSILHTHLHAILRKYDHREASAKGNLNLIVLTDGHSIEDWDFDEIRESISSTTEALDKRDAPVDQIGVQFVLVDGYRGQERFQRLDDDMSKELNTTRYVTIRTYSEADLICTLGISLTLRRSRMHPRT